MMPCCQVICGATHYKCLVPPSFRARQLQCVEQSRGKGFWAARLFCWYTPATHLVAEGGGQQALLAPAVQLLVQISRWCVNGGSSVGDICSGNSRHLTGFCCVAAGTPAHGVRSRQRCWT